MRKSLHVLFFILAFQIEVRVRAAEALLEHPPRCFESSETCALQVLAPGFHISDKDKKIHATPGSTVMRSSDEQWRLIKGTLWVEKGSLQIQTPYADLHAARGQYWVLTQEDRIVVRNMDSDLSLTLRDGKRLQVPEGFEVWVAGLDSQGLVNYGMIKPIDIKAHLPLWSSLYRGSKDSFRKDVLGYKVYWGNLAAKSGEIYKEVVMREIAAEEASRKAAELKKQRQAEENRRMKELFWKRSFER